MAAGNIFGLAITLVLTVVIVTEVLIPQFTGTNTTTWSPAMIAVWGLGGLICAAGVIYFLGRAFGLI